MNIMRTPKRISRLLLARQAYIDKNVAALRRSVMRSQDKILEGMLSSIVPRLDTRGGVILDTMKNYRLLTAVDVVYDKISALASTDIVSRMGSVTAGISDQSARYFQIVSPQLVDKLNKVSAITKTKMDLRIGLDAGKMIRGGFMETVLKNEGMKGEIKQFVSRAVTGQFSMADFNRGMNRIITGAGEVSGGLDKQFQQFGYDLYSQYDAAYNANLAEELDFEYFIYQGGLIPESRDFCREHNNRVYSRKEAEEWRNWTPSKAVNISEFKQKNLNEVPSYLGYAGYEPLVDRGGYNCRHMPGYIPDSMAFRLRPDLNENV